MSDLCPECGRPLAETVIEPPAATALEPATATGLPAPGDRFGEFVVERLLGRGGMGVVYLARQEAVDRPVALKVLGGRGPVGRALLERFEREASVVAALGHDHIVRLHATGTTGQLPWFAMEYVDGAPLSAAIAGGRLEPRRAARLARQVALGLAHAHRKGVIHRDIKPDNVLLTTDAEGGEKALLADFGIARELDVDRTRMTVAGQVFGTPHYMSPEQARGDIDRIDTRSDLYSLGATLFEMLTGRPVFEAPTPHAILLRILEEEAPGPRSLRPDLPVDLDNVCRKLLAADPEARYRSADELADDLARFLDGRAVRATPPSLVYQARKLVGRHRAATVLATVLIAVLSIGAAAWIRSREDARAAREREAARTEAALTEALLRLGDLETDRGRFDRALEAYAAHERRGERADLVTRWRLWDARRHLDGGARYLALAPGDDPTALALDADGSRLAVGTGGGVVRVLGAGGEVVAAWTLGPGLDDPLALRGSGPLLARIGPDREGVADALYLLGPTEARRLAGGVGGLAVDPSGSRAAWSVGDAVWATDRARPGEATATSIEGRHLSLGPDGLLAVQSATPEPMAAEQHGLLSFEWRILDLATGRPIGRLAGPAGGSPPFAPDARVVLMMTSLAMEATDVDTGRVVGALPTRLLDGALLSAGRLLGRHGLPFNEATYLIVHDLGSGAVVRLLGPTRNLWTNSGDGTRVAIATPDDRILVAPTAPSSAVRILLGSGGTPRRLHFTPDDRHLVALDRTGLTRWDLDAEEPSPERLEVDLHQASIEIEGDGAVVRPAGRGLRRWAAGASADEPIEGLEAGPDEVLLPLPGGRVLRWPRRSGRPTIVDRTGRRPTVEIDLETGRREPLDILAAADRLLLRWTQPGVTRLVDCATGAVAEIEVRPAGTLPWALSPDGAVALRVDGDRIDRWSAADGTGRPRLTTSPARGLGNPFLLSVACAPDGRTIAAAGVGGVALLDAETGDILVSWPLPASHHRPTAIAFGPAGRRLAIAYDGFVRLLELDAFGPSPVTGE